MKRLFTFIILLAALPHICVAQKSKHHLMSEWRDGDYIVRRYIVEDDTLHKAKYELHYAINSATTAPEYEHNDIELERLDRFFAELKSDTLRHVSSITIAGYASPDGNARSNETLALSRAQKFRNMLDSRFNASTHYKVQLSSAVEPWKACDDGVENSAIADKQKVLDLINSSAAAPTIESQLKSMPAVWSVFRTSILPALRRVDMTVYYNTDTIFELRTLIEKPNPQPAPQPQRRCSCPVIVEDEMIGIIVDMNPRKHHHKHGKHHTGKCR